MLVKVKGIWKASYHLKILSRTCTKLKFMFYKRRIQFNCSLQRIFRNDLFTFEGNVLREGKIKWSDFFMQDKFKGIRKACCYIFVSDHLRCLRKRKI